MQLLQQLRPVFSWSLAPVKRQQRAKTWDSIQGSRYPIKLLRYWFAYHLIQEEANWRGRPLRIAEIGIDKGQMLHFIRDAGFSDIEQWDGVDYLLSPEAREAGYSSLTNADVDQPDFELHGQYDVIILLHILEHLYEPARLLTKLAHAIKPDGVIVGGYPVIPRLVVSHHQKTLRAVTGKTGHHVSAFSPQCTREMAEGAGLDVEFMSGTFMVRMSGSFLEESRAWTRANLLYGALCQSLGGELYWLMRKRSST